MYGTQALQGGEISGSLFENDVKMYGTQATSGRSYQSLQFENDVMV